jgi:hypothetical protein
VNTERKKEGSKYKELKTKLNLTASKAIIDMVITKITLLGIEPHVPAS